MVDGTFHCPISGITFPSLPLMYKVYHQDTDDMLSRHHITQLVLETVEKSATRLKIDVDWELFKVDPRDLSVDIIVPYKDTDDTLSDHMDVEQKY